ncbi:MAG TPA: hypothetical protein PLO29_08815, partial [Paludibacter sp.]|nr:hypothetical protein [Paludibacter sp.]
MKKYFTKILAIAAMLLIGAWHVNGQTTTYSGSYPIILTNPAEIHTNPVSQGWAGTTNAPTTASRSNKCITGSVTEPNFNSGRNITYRIPNCGAITIQANGTAGRGFIITINKVSDNSQISRTVWAIDNATCSNKTITVNVAEAVNIQILSPTAVEDPITGTGSSYISSIEITEYVPASPIIASFTIAGIPATIDQAAGTITAELIYGTNLTNITPNIVLGGNAISYTPTGAQDFSNSSTTPVTYTASDGTNTKNYAVTLTTQATAGKELTELIFSNSFNAFIKGETVAAYYMAGQAKPTIQSYQASAGATVAISADGTKVVVTGADDVDRELALTLEPVTPITGSTSVTFDGTETWIKTGNAFDATKGWVFSKDVEDPDNKRISEGKSRIYFFVGSYSKLTFTSGTVARNIKVFANGTELLSPTSTAPSGETFDIDLSGASNYMIGIYSNKTNGDGGVTAMSSVITSVKQTQELGISFDGKTIRNPNGVALHVFDIAGRLVHASHTDIEMNNNQKGIYIVKSGADAMKI